MPKFKEEKKNGMLGLTTTLTEVGADDKPLEGNPFTIQADSAGIKFFGESRRISDMVELQEFAKTIDRAWRLHLTYRTKITNAAGH